MTRQDQRGFTLVELMIAVAVMGVLAAIIIPEFSKETKKAKADTEVTPMFAELSVKEEQYKIENNVFLSAPACPATPSATLQSVAGCIAAGEPWEDLRVNPPISEVRCSYEVTAGAAADNATNPSGFTFQSPPMAWYYILATCDMDGSAGVNSTYFMSSVDTMIQKKNVGN